MNLCETYVSSFSNYLYFFCFHQQLGKTAKDAASKVSTQSEEIGKTEAFKTVSKVYVRDSFSLLLRFVMFNVCSKFYLRYYCQGIILMLIVHFFYMFSFISS